MRSELVERAILELTRDRRRGVVPTMPPSFDLARCLISAALSAMYGVPYGCVEGRVCVRGRGGG